MDSSIIPSFTKPTGLKTYEIVQYVTGFLPGELQDWPAQVQDAIYAALERKAKEVELPLAIVASYCTMDPALEEGGIDRPLIHVIASEIVVADSRFLRDTEQQMREAFSNLLAGRPLQ